MACFTSIFASSISFLISSQSISGTVSKTEAGPFTAKNEAIESLRYGSKMLPLVGYDFDSMKTHVKYIIATVTVELDLLARSCFIDDEEMLDAILEVTVNKLNK